MVSQHAPVGDQPIGRAPVGAAKSNTRGGFIPPVQAAKFVSDGQFQASMTGWYRVLLVGGGGAGAKAWYAKTERPGASGAGSGFVWGGLIRLSAGEVVSVSVGTGATASPTSGVRANGGLTRFGAHATANGGMGAQSQNQTQTFTSAGAGFSGGGQAANNFVSSGGAAGGANGSDGGIQASPSIAAPGQGHGCFDAFFSTFVTWTVAGASPPASPGSYQCQGGSGVQIDTDSLGADDGGFDGMASGGGQGGNGYGAGGGGGLYSSSDGEGGNGAAGLCLVEGPVLTG